MSLPYYKRFPKDFLEGTIGMDLETKGAYGIVLDLIYMRDGRLEDDPRYIAGQLGCSVRKWNSLRQKLIEMDKLTVENGIISNFRADYLVEERRTYRDKKSENRARPNKNSDLEKRASDSAHVKPEPEPEDTLDSRAAGPSISEIRSACLQAAGMTDADLTPAMIAPTPIVHLIRPASGEPCDLQLDVIPAIQSCAASLRQRGQTLKAWSYCREAIIRNRDARLSGAPAVEHRPGARPSQRPASTASARKHAERDAAFDALVDQLENGMGGQDGPEDYGFDSEPGGSESRVIELDRTQFARVTGTDR